jgi:NTE family protein
MPPEHPPAEPSAVAVRPKRARSVLFLHEHVESEYAGDPGRALDVVRTPLDHTHVLASSAIPVAFRPVQVVQPVHATGWYVDGGVRLNTPLQPAVHLGASHIVVVSATPTSYGDPLPPAPVAIQPDVADAAALVLTAVLGDRTAEDLQGVLRTNRLLEQAPGLRRRDGEAPGVGDQYRRLRVLAVAPEPGVLGARADKVFRRRTARAGWLTENDNWLLGRFLRGAGDGAGRRELLSYLFFDEQYFAAGIELGRDAARTALAAGWQE